MALEIDEILRWCIDEEPNDAEDEANYAHEARNHQPARVETFSTRHSGMNTSWDSLYVCIFVVVGDTLFISVMYS